MIEQAICENCQTKIPIETTGGLCPGCLLAGVIETGKVESALAETLNSDSDSSFATNAFAGEIFGNFDSLEEISRGGMGVVFKARHCKLNRAVALKMILAGQLASEQDVQRFHREAEAAANLNHPGIVPIYEIGEHENQHYFAMRLIEGGSLASEMESQRQNLRGLVRLLERVSRAVHHAHQRGILHRDLKPANVLLDEDGQPMIADFGLARSIEPDGSDITRTGAVVGTPAYMPPEQAAAGKDITSAADIYAIGAMLYEAIVGHPPHVGDSPMNTLLKVINDDVVPPRQINPKTNRLLERICMKCLERDPNERYASAAALAEDLDSWLAGRPISVRRPSVASSLTNLVKVNVRSAIGAGVVGILAGLLVAYFVSPLYGYNYLRATPPDHVYEKLPAEIPIGRWLVFLNDSKKGFVDDDLHGLIGWLVTSILVGGTVASVTRPKPGSEAVSIGIVAGLLMAITLFATNFGFGSVSKSTAPLIGAMSELTTGTFGSDQEREKTRQLFLEEFPGLEKLDTKEKRELLAFRMYYDCMLMIPVGMLWGMAASTVFSLPCCLVGTSYASRLLVPPNRGWVRLPRYLEMMIVAQALMLIPLAIWMDANRFSQATTATRIGIGMSISFLFVMAVITYRGTFRWYWRLAMYPTFILLLGMLLG